MSTFMQVESLQPTTAREEPTTAERATLRTCLLRPLPEIPPRYFYDDEGSRLFEEITGLSVYYQTRTELSILAQHAPAIMAATQPQRLVELGSGAGRKIRTLLDAWRQRGGRGTCTMLDVNELFLRQSVAALSAAYPEFTFRWTVGDFTTDLQRLGPGGGRLTLLFAGTIGNFYPEERHAFLVKLRRQMVGTDALLVGVDLVKDPARLEAAYNDPQGVTAAFNRNILNVLNRRFGADFRPEAFAHRAFYDPQSAWIEMRLQALQPMQVHVPSVDLSLSLSAGQELRTEISAKFTLDSLQAAARRAALDVTDWFPDPDGLFALALLRRTPEA